MMATVHLTQLSAMRRGFDPVAPIIHEWTYEAMAYDLLNLEDGRFKYTAETGVGKETKEHVLQDKDELWSSMRHKFIADVQRELADMMTSFSKKNRAAKYKVGYLLQDTAVVGAHVGQTGAHSLHACDRCSELVQMQWYTARGLTSA